MSKLTNKDNSELIFARLVYYTELATERTSTLSAVNTKKQHKIVMNNAYNIIFHKFWNIF